MKHIQSKQFIAAAAIVFFGFIGIFGLSGYLEKAKPPLPEGFEDQDLALQGAKLKGYSLGFEGLIADWYWMQSLQYVGRKIIDNKDENISIENLSSLNPRLLYPLLDNASDLDPQFMAVYEYGAVVLPAIDPQQAVKITEKGIENNPDRWRLYQHLGFIYWKLKDYEKAAEAYSQGSRIKDAPDFMRMMAAKMKTEGGSRETARAIYQQMFEESDDRQVKENAALRLLEIDSLDERDAIRAALRAWQEKNNRCPGSFREIFPLLQKVRLPGKDFRIDNSNNLVDPSGAPYVLDTQTCDVQLDKTKTKIPLN